MALTYAHAETLPKNYQVPAGDAGVSKMPYTFKASQMKATALEGGSVKIIDSTIFNTSKTIASAEVTVEPGAIR